MKVYRLSAGAKTRFPPVQRRQAQTLAERSRQNKSTASASGDSSYVSSRTSSVRNFSDQHAPWEHGFIGWIPLTCQEYSVGETLGEPTGEPQGNPRAYRQACSDTLASRRLLREPRWRACGHPTVLTDHPAAPTVPLPEAIAESQGNRWIPSHTAPLRTGLALRRPRRLVDQTSLVRQFERPQVPIVVSSSRWRATRDRSAARILTNIASLFARARKKMPCQIVSLFAKPRRPRQMRK